MGDEGIAGVLSFIGVKVNTGTIRREEGHSLYTEVCRLSVDENVHQKITNMLSIKTSSMLMISVLENILVESEWCFGK